MTSQASAGMPPQTLPSSGLGKQPAPPPIPHELLVKPVLDRARPCAVHPEQRALGLLAEFDLEPGGDDARLAQPTSLSGFQADDDQMSSGQATTVRYWYSRTDGSGSKRPCCTVAGLIVARERPRSICLQTFAVTTWVF